MSIQSRSKLITFRLTEEEYEQFLNVCYANGPASVSEMARVAVNRLVEQPGHATDEALTSLVKDLEARMRLLVRELNKLTARSSAVISASQREESN